MGKLLAFPTKQTQMQEVCEKICLNSGSELFLCGNTEKHLFDLSQLDTFLNLLERKVMKTNMFLDKFSIKVLILRVDFEICQFNMYVLSGF